MVYVVLLLGVPLAISAAHLEWDPTLVFLSSLLALCPLAERLAFVTEDIAKYTNHTVGGLINASFGNMVS